MLRCELCELALMHSSSVAVTKEGEGVTPGCYSDQDQHLIVRWEPRPEAVLVLTKTVHNGRVGLGKPSRGKSAVFLNIVQKAFDPPPPLLFEHLSYFAGGVFLLRF